MFNIVIPYRDTSYGIVFPPIYSCSQNLDRCLSDHGDMASIPDQLLPHWPIIWGILSPSLAHSNRSTSRNIPLATVNHIACFHSSTAVHRTLIDACRTVVIWLVYLINFYLIDQSYEEYRILSPSLAHSNPSTSRNIPLATVNHIACFHSSTAVHRMLIDACRTMVIWLVDPIDQSYEDTLPSPSPIPTPIHLEHIPLAMLNYIAFFHPLTNHMRNTLPSPSPSQPQYI